MICRDSFQADRSSRPAPDLASNPDMDQSTIGATSADLNLTTHRAGTSVWQRPGWDGTNEVAMTRWLVGVGGGALALEGLRRGGRSGSFFAGLGGSLVWWALSGEGDLSTARRWFNDVLERSPWGHAEDPVFAASADSFPASDAPAFTSTVGTGARPKHR